MSLKVLYGELLNRLSNVMDPSSDLRDSKPKRGRKKSIDVSILFCRKNPNMLPVNELTWPELARRYLLAVFFMDGEADLSESGNVFRCLIGDGGELCGSLTGVLGMEADALVPVLYEKLQGYARLGCLSADSKDKVDRAMDYASALPKAPWEAAICKICGIDKDDSLVLLCDTCDAEYHTYCVNSPLAA